MELDDFLEPGERVLWQAGPTKLVPPWSLHVEPVLVGGIVGILELVLFPLLRWSWDETTGRPDFTALPPPFDRWTLPAVGFVVLGVAVVLSELAVYARWRRTRYAITDRRVLEFNSLGFVAQLARDDVGAAQVRRRALAIEAKPGKQVRFAGKVVAIGTRRSLVFAGIDDPGAALSALAAHPGVDASAFVR